MGALKVNPYGKFFVDPENSIRIEMATMEEKNEYGLHDVLLKITGAAAHDEGIDGKVMLYSAYPAGTGSNFGYKKGTEDKVRMLTRDTWGSWKFFEVFVNGQNFKVYADNTKNNDVRPLHLVSEFKG